MSYESIDDNLQSSFIVASLLNSLELLQLDTIYIFERILIKKISLLYLKNCTKKAL